MQNFDIQVNRKDFHQYKLVEKPNFKAEDVEEGQILVKINRFAFTANNITYAAVGEKVGYWNFFPVSDDWGVIPVWGYADVVLSKNEQIPIGARYYGYYPMGSHLLMSPNNIKASGFTDDMPHRQALPPIYNNYTNTATDPSYSKAGEAYQCLFRPLFTTAFLIDDFMAENEFFTAQNIILTSASSKTAIGLACLLAKRKKDTSINIIGLTSTRNKEFVSSLGYYDQVLSYEEKSEIRDNEKVVIVDFSGNTNLQIQLQDQLGDHLSYNCLVGMVDWTNRGGANSGNIKGTIFFAPTHALKRTKEWGGAGFQKRLAKSWQIFTNDVNHWMKIETSKGAKGLTNLYPIMLEGKMNPKTGHMVDL
jgi:hypothetical protein